MGFKQTNQKIDMIKLRCFDLGREKKAKST